MVDAGGLTHTFDQFADEFENDVVGFVRIVLGVGEDTFDENGKQTGGIWPDQLELLLAYQSRDKKWIAKRSGHRVGKTTALGWIILHQGIFRYPQKTVCTSATSAQLFEALYAETVQWYNKLPEELKVFNIKSEIFEHKADKEGSFISFRTSSEEKPQALAGVHSDWVLLIIDEASDVPEKLFESGSGSMAGKNAITILTGNPTRRTGTFFDAFNKPSVMPFWKRFHTSSLGHPNVDPIYPQFIAAQYGEDSNAYRVRILGEFPLVDDDTVIPWGWLDAALKRDVEVTINVRPIWGVDVARKGKDFSALAKRQGNALLEPVKSWHGRDTMQTVGIIKSAWDETLPSMRPSDINIDLIGIGSGVVDRLRELNLPARGVNVSESASLKPRYVGLRDELWWKGREWFEAKNSRMHGVGWKRIQKAGGEWIWELAPGEAWQDDITAAELSWPTMDYTSAGKLKVEAKRDTKKRTGENSPNHADALLMTFASEAITAAGTDKQPRSWNEAVKREIKGIV